MVNEILNIKGARNIFFSCGQFFSVGTVYTVYSIQCTMFKTELDWMGNNFTRFTLVVQFIMDRSTCNLKSEVKENGKTSFSKYHHQM